MEALKQQIQSELDKTAKQINELSAGLQEANKNYIFLSGQMKTINDLANGSEESKTTS